jgi:hypothetical protein
VQEALNWKSIFRQSLCAFSDPRFHSNLIHDAEYPNATIFSTENFIRYPYMILADSPPTSFQILNLETRQIEYELKGLQRPTQSTLYLSRDEDLVFYISADKLMAVNFKTGHQVWAESYDPDTSSPEFVLHQNGYLIITFPQMTMDPYAYDEVDGADRVVVWDTRSKPRWNVIHDAQYPDGHKLNMGNKVCS